MTWNPATVNLRPGVFLGGREGRKKKVHTCQGGGVYIDHESEREERGKGREIDELKAGPPPSGLCLGAEEDGRDFCVFRKKTVVERRRGEGVARDGGEVTGFKGGTDS